MSMQTLGTSTLSEERRETSAWSLLKRVVKDLAKYKLAMILISISIATYSLTSLASPYVLSIIIDEYILKGNLQDLPILVSLYMLLLIGQWASMTTNTYYIQKVGQLYLRDLRNKLFSKLQELSIKFFNKRRIGDLVSAIINDTSTLNDVLISGILSVLGHLISLVGVIAIMIYMSPSLTAVTLANIPLLVVIARVFGIKLKEAHRIVRRNVADATIIVEESIAGISTIKVFGNEGNVLRTFSNISNNIVKAFVKVAKLMGLFWPSMDLSVTLSTVFVLIFGGYMVSIGAISIGVVIAFIQYVNRLARPITEFINMYDSLQAAIASAERIFAILDSKEVEYDRPDAIELRYPRGEIELRNISFSYIPGKPVLRNVNLRIRPGEVVAIVGRTGVGKTTLINLIMRFYDPDEGQILIDGVDIRRLKLSNLRRIISYIPQETYLFPGTIMENIKLGNPEASDEEIITVCKRLGIHEFIERLPKGYMTDAGEMGKKLSTGEKQLIAIARAMLRNPAIVIFDEAMSSIDVVTEALLKRAMRRLLRGRTGIIIAHRLSTIMDCDRIIVLEDGKIIEEGRHHELLKVKGKYYELYESMIRAFTS